MVEVIHPPEAATSAAAAGPATSPDPPADLAEADRLFRRSELGAAEQICRRILKEDPDHPGALHRLGEIALRWGAPGLAVALLTRAARLAPGEPAYAVTLGAALRNRGQAQQAEAGLRLALDAHPQHTPLRTTLALALMDQGKLTDSLCVLDAALAGAERDATLHHTRGVVQVVAGAAAEALASFRRAAALSPDWAEAHTGVLFAQHYVPGLDPAALTAGAVAWAARHADPLAAAAPPHPNDRDPHRRLRLGYLSGDLRAHPVGRILSAVLPAHDPTQVEVFCYSNHWRSDAITAALRAAAHHWRSVVHLSDDAAAAAIRADQIDVLVDLSGHTGANRLLVAARRPAPVQAMWLGYFDTTGTRAIDYVIADRHVCPPRRRAAVRRAHRAPAAFLPFLCAPPTTPPT